MAKKTKAKPAKKKTAAPRSVALQGVHSTLADRYGPGGLMTADQVANFAIPRISSGILTLDIALGGGWPVGRFASAFGNESTGKSALFLRAVASAQRTCGGCFRLAELVQGEVESMDPNTGEVQIVEAPVISCDCGNPKNMVVAWLDIEGAWDPSWVQALGVILPRVILSRPETAEHCIDTIDLLLDSGAIDIVVLDSIAQMSPTKEAEDSAYQAKDNVGLGARIMNSAFRKWNVNFLRKWRESIADGSWNVPTVWMVNQTRENIGMFKAPETRPMGRGQRFITSVDVRTSGGKYKGDEKAMETHQVELAFQVVKNKTAPAKRKGTYKMCLVETDLFKVGQILDFDDALFHGLRTNMVEQPSDKKYSFNGIEFVGRNKLFDYWAENLDQYEALKASILEVLC